MILRFWEIISKMWTGRSQVDSTTNLNLFSEFLSLYCINRYVGQKTRLNSYVAGVLDRQEIYTVTNPLKLFLTTGVVQPGSIIINMFLWNTKWILFVTKDKKKHSTYLLKKDVFFKFLYNIWRQCGMNLVNTNTVI